MEYIERRQFIDLQWSLLTETERLAQLNANLSDREQKTDAENLDQYLGILEDYANNKEELDNADNRVFSFADHLASAKAGAKEAVGRPKIKI